MTRPILVVSLNPALDVTHHVSRVDWAGVNRPRHVAARPGGKGLNVAFTLLALGAAVRVAGLAGGAAGAAVLAGAAAGGVPTAFAAVSGETRRSFTVVDADRGQAAVFNEPGPQISGAEFTAFQAIYAAELAGASVVVMTGSLPPGLDTDRYAVLIAMAKQVAVPAVLDAGGEPLRLGAAAAPEIIKPNLAELELAVGRSLRAAPPAGATEPPAELHADLAAVAGAARDLLSAGARAAVVSLGPDGLLALTGEGCWHVVPPDVPVRNPTGAGDAVVAGLALGLARGLAWPERLRRAAALGAATVTTPVAGEFDRADYERLVASMPVPGLKGF